jgi:hypothetical protein
MKNLVDFKKESLNISNLFKINGGDGLTRWRENSNSHWRSDTYSDDNGDGRLNSGDTVTTDDGRQICP